MGWVSQLSTLDVRRSPPLATQPRQTPNDDAQPQ
jgi:hypothetical protein